MDSTGWSPDIPGDSTWNTSCGLDWRWTGGGLKIAHLAGGSSLGPPAVLAQSLSSPCPVLVES